MQIENDYDKEVYNGDIGYIDAVDPNAGERLVVLVGQKKAVAIAVRNASGRRRWSKLAEWLSGTAPKRG
jgi:ATP-dependent exoDNAse (exonuclease V) alpha subunit